MSLILRFCGATRTVTGSCYWLRTPNSQFLIDCGMFQGSKTLKDLNYQAFPFDPRKIDFVLLTHAHIDHSGLLPKLIKSGFSGPVYMTAGTRELLSFMLPDSGHIQEMEVEQLNARNDRRGKPRVAPIYTQSDAATAQQFFKPIDYETWLELANGIRARFWNAGHILGSSSIELEIATDSAEQRLLRLLFSGDIGPEHKLFHPDPVAPENFDYVISEATYGGRKRQKLRPEERRRVITRIVKEALRADGILLIPAFAVERTQELVADLTKLQAGGAIPLVPIFIDSPLAIEVTKIFDQHASDLDDMDGVGSLLHHSNIFPTPTADDSKRLDQISGGAIIIAGSGMCEAGRIRHHLKRWLWHRGATVLLTGYQAKGTLGRLLADGVTSVKIQGSEIKVQAAIRQTDLYSGHADGDELVEWILARRPIKRALYLTHGEEAEIAVLTDELIKRGLLRDRIISPALDDEIELSPDGTGPRVRSAPRRLPAESVVHPDWHNDLAQLSLDLRAALDTAGDDKSRNIILRRIRRAISDHESRS
jgi:metallo-beta-lactamase family protein